MKKIMVLLSTAFLFCGAIIVNAQDVEELREQAQKQMEDLSNTLNELKQAYNDDAMKVGDTIVLESGVIITLENAEITPLSEDDSYFDEVNGTLIRVDLTVDNQTSERLSINAHDFEMYDGDRIITDHLAKGYFSEDIAQGMKATGSIYYDIQNVGILTFMIESDVWTINTDELETIDSSKEDETAKLSESEDNLTEKKSDSSEDTNSFSEESEIAYWNNLAYIYGFQSYGGQTDFASYVAYAQQAVENAQTYGDPYYEESYYSEPVYDAYIEDENGYIYENPIYEDRYGPEESFVPSTYEGW